jgi:hypothetical protein
VDNLLHTPFVLIEDLLDPVRYMLLFDDDVLNPDSETMVDKPGVNDLLGATHKVSAYLRPEIFNNQVVKPLTCSTNDTFIYCPA